MFDENASPEAEYHTGCCDCDGNAIDAVRIFSPSEPKEILLVFLNDTEPEVKVVSLTIIPLIPVWISCVPGPLINIVSELYETVTLLLPDKITDPEV